jgi:UMF1 family MFS transporter
MATPSEITAGMEDRAYRKIINAWTMYDWANSAFATIIMASVFQLYYTDVAAATVSWVKPTSLWGLTVTISQILVAVTAPILGAIADHSGTRKRLLGGFAGVGILLTVAMVSVSRGEWLWASCLYIAGFVGWAGANIFYDSLLPHVARRGDIDQVSTRGYAMGYVGGGLLLAFNLIMIRPNLIGLESFPGIPNAEWAPRLSFVTVAIWWAVFAIPLFRRVAEPPAVVADDESPKPLQAAFQRLRHTLHGIRRYRQLAKFLVAFWLYNDGIGSVMQLAGSYGTDIGAEWGQIIGAILMAQFIGIPFTIAFGQMARRLGTKRSILLGLAVYTVVAVFGYFMKPQHFWILAFMVAMVQGGSQALSRSLYGAMCPKARTSEFFGFYDVSSKFAGILGPATYAGVGMLTGSSRLSTLSLAAFFVGGAWLLMRVNEQEGIRVAREEDAKAANHQQ